MTIKAPGWLLLGTAGSVLVAAGSWGAGALPLGVPGGVWGQPGQVEMLLGFGLFYAGLVLLVAGWWWLGRLLRDGAGVSRGQQRSALLCWSLPLLPCPLLFSSDAYSYVAEGALSARGWDVYRLGPGALGGALSANVPRMWQDTPAPYGPVFLAAARAVVAVTGEGHVVAATMGMRLLAMAGLALAVMAVLRLAADIGGTGARAAAGALWATALSPLVLLHMVGGAHNDALMLGAMMAGLVAFRRGRWVAGTVLLTTAALIKAPAGVALLCAAVVAVAGRAGWARRAWLATGILVVAAGAGLLEVLLCRQGFGWVRTLGAPVSVRTMLSPSTDVGALLEWLASVVGWRAGTGTLMAAARTAGLLAGSAAVVYWARRAPRTGAEYAVGMALLTVVVCAPAVQVWYLLWGLVPLAAVSWRTLAHPVAKAATMATFLVVMPIGVGPTWPSALAAVTGGLAAVTGLAWWWLLRGGGRAALRAAGSTLR
ncbi:polyprenol phosphomannose-dependent alpha 1,6 mannosyltransferase MptB [Streptomyces sp. FXJ1.172]|uniref:polyprenol phosphomannose-dependent alpha 1,6 mannosyltransferase MptB n=1 Tax=Streptomyces sp. FXJ1.172 TaxID=710705 RepID=UPI0007CF62D8|nr:polyprenol phosphomannose-dependent alpha 1,6 mannosyltransferase MptB [Streptomyces sp. FXJ1.172]WEO92929.1 polyprenol phosphomannose-dependent alpha 1,6 mannosyltransferase MptB [Streptomyces sp. FXJ1.172]